MEKITAVVQTYNASLHLDRVLKSLKDFDEVLVVDMESTDDTVDIAKRNGARVEVWPRGEHRIVEAYREKAVHAASNPWVLVVDADEIVPKALREYLYAEINRDPSPRGMLIPLKNYFMGRWMKCYYPSYIFRFFHKEGSKWPYRIHSRPIINGPVIKIPHSRTDLAMIHLANDSYRTCIDKLNKYTEQEKDRRAPRYKRWQLFIAPWFCFAKTYIFKGGFRDGIPGFIHAVFDAFYRFSALSKIEEERQAALPRHDIDPYLRD